MSRGRRGLITASAVISVIAACTAWGTPAVARAQGPPEAAAAPDAAPGRPFTFTLAYTADSLANTTGGLATGVRYVDQLRLSAAYDGAVAGHDGLTGLVTIEHHNGSRFSGELVGDSQVVTNLEAPPEAFRLYEAWLQKDTLGGRAGVKVGLIDLNSTFDVQETAGLFLNSSHGIGIDFSDTGLNGPSINPTPALAVTGFVRDSEGWTGQIGVFDGVAGDPGHRRRFVDVQLTTRAGALLVAQVERRVGGRRRFEAGGWAYTSDFDALGRFDAHGAPVRLGANAGLYALAEARLIDRPGSEEGGLAGWVRAGIANGQINRVDHYLGGGLVYTGLIKGREQDQIGAAIASAHFGDGARRLAALAGAGLDGAETTLEITYRYAFRDWVALQPDVQYVIHPGGDPKLSAALVVGLRMSLTPSH